MISSLKIRIPILLNKSNKIPANVTGIPISKALTP
ncbi:hypothetical protein FHU12_5264 [Serratia marcescens]|uniref:Uncharacterized protein n=1 Tax=Serratia marcescens TaxID=615 RepID=A0AA46QDR1_SERMA|nr:hypothetical protein FHU12_5264 [Serratia marcescens]